MKKWQRLVAATLVIVGIAMVVSFVTDNPKLSISVVPNPAVGIITKVSEESISLKMGDGQEFIFTNGVQDISVDHLKEHADSKEPVSITWQDDGGRKRATRVDDVL